jgi:mono/diheme cytochrome c family protein
MFPPLTHNANVQSADPTTVIRVIIEGARTVPTTSWPTPFAMPPFNWKLSDEQIAAVATFVRNAWGNAASVVTAEEVKSVAESCTRRRSSSATVTRSVTPIRILS